MKELACEVTWNFLETLTRLGLEFECPIIKLIKLTHTDGTLKALGEPRYRRREK